MKFRIYFNRITACLIALYLIFLTDRVQAQRSSLSDSLHKDTSRVELGDLSRNARLLTSSVSWVNGASLGQNFNTNLGNTLYGRLTGLSVLQNATTGEPGLNNPNFYVRGINTSSASQPYATGTYFGSGTAPLMIIDGFVGNFTQLNPEEVEQITVLKDAGALAVYGLRGANGVIVVTTKKGKTGPLNITFTTEQGFNQAEYRPNYLGSYDYARLNNEARKNDGLSPLYTDADLAAYQSGSDPYFHPDVNWYDQVLRKAAPVAKYNLNFSGGNRTVNYFVLLNAISSQGLYKKFGDQNNESSNSTYNRYNFRSNLDIVLSKNLTANFILGGTIEDKKNPGNFSTSGIFSALSLLPPNAFPVNNPNGTFGGNSAYSNPVGDLLNQGFYSTNGRNLQSSFRLTEKLDMVTRGLRIFAFASVNSYFTSYSAKSKTYQRYAISKDATTGNVNYSSYGTSTSLTGTETQTDQYNSNTYGAGLDYERTFKIHQVSANLQYNSEEAIFANTGSGRNSLPYNHVGGSGRMMYVNSGRYIGEFSFGYQGSEQFAKGKRFGFFPASSIGWLISEEKFLKTSKVVSFLKLRGSYGLTGNDNIASFSNSSSPRFAFVQYYPLTQSYYLGTANNSVTSRVEGAIANPDITWEKEKKLDIGLDATLFKTVDLTVDVFKNDRYNILASPNGAIPQITGITLSYINIAKNTNKGIEGSLRYHYSGRSAFAFYTEINGSYARNKVTYNAEALQLNRYQYTTGKPLGQPFGYVALGLFTPEQMADPSVAKPVGVAVQAGDIRYQDLNGDGKIDNNDTKAIGKTAIPATTVGWHSGMSYKNVDLDFVLQGVTGTTAYLGTNYYQAFQNNGKISAFALNRYTPATAATADYPRLSTTGNLNNYRYSTFYQRDGSYIKLRSVELGYNFSQRLASRAHLKNARLFVNATNLFILDHLSNTDPETLSGYPPQRTFCLGAKIKI